MEAPGSGSAKIALPILREGSYHIEVFALSKGSTTNWATGEFQVCAESHVEAVELDRDWAKIGTGSISPCGASRRADLAPYGVESLARNGVTLLLQGGPPSLELAGNDISYIPYEASFRASSHTLTAMLDPSTGFLKSGCVYDEQRMREAIRRTVEASRGAREHGAFAYSLGDENAVRAGAAWRHGFRHASDSKFVWLASGPASCIHTGGPTRGVAGSNCDGGLGTGAGHAGFCVQQPGR